MTTRRLDEIEKLSGSAGAIGDCVIREEVRWLASWSRRAAPFVGNALGAGDTSSVEWDDARALLAELDRAAGGGA